MLSSYFYMNIDDIWINPALKLVAVIINYKNNAVPDQNINLFIITYTNNDCLTSLNDWNSSNYFIVLFLTFFSFGIGGHFAPNKKSRKIKIFIDVWEKWALFYHLRRYDDYYILNIYQYQYF